jgi:hypothetical protein
MALFLGKRDGSRSIGSLDGRIKESFPGCAGLLLVVSKVLVVVLVLVALDVMVS